MNNENLVYQPNGSNAGYAIGQSVHEISLLGGVVLGAKAGKNHYARTGDLAESAWLGARAGLQWFVWFLACFLTIVEGLLGAWFVSLVNSPGFHDYSDNPREALSYAYGFAIAPLIMVPLLLVLYNRNVDFSLFKRRLAYWLIKPVAVVLDWVPNFVLYGMAFVLPILIASLTD